MRIGKTAVTAALAAGFLSLATASAQSPSQSTLRVQINPDALVQIPPSGLQWIAAGNTQTMTIPATALLRLNAATTGTLAIYQDAPASSGIQVETAQGAAPLPSTAVTIRSYSRSGRYQDPLVLRAPYPAPGGAPVTLILRLSSSDHAAEWLRPIVIPAPSSAAPSS